MVAKWIYSCNHSSLIFLVNATSWKSRFLMQGGSPEIGFRRSKPAALIRGFIYGTRTQRFFLNSPSKSPFLVIQIPKSIWTCHIFRLCSLGEDGWSTIGEPRHLASPNYGEKRLVDNKKWVFSATKSNTLSNKSIQTDTLFQQYIFFFSWIEVRING